MDEDRAEGAPLPAGAFSAWLGGMRRALDGDAPSDVPCAGCTGCCRSSQFVHIGPDETDTLAHIPSELLFPAPRMPAGNVLLGYDENGHCPMLVDDRCSIYQHRPRTCRTYDCRVFPAAGLTLEGDEKQPIARRAGRWRFEFTDDDDRVRHGAVRAASAYLQTHADLLPGANATQKAVLAVRLHDAFLGADGDVAEPAAETVRARLR
jgi:Fe-S-cluster containining protein